MYQPRNIDCKKIKPHLTELVLRCGSPEKAASYIGIGTSTLYRIMHNYHCTVQMRTAQLILDGLSRKRTEDRRAGVVNNKLITKVRDQVLREEKMERKRTQREREESLKDLLT